MSQSNILDNVKIVKRHNAGGVIIGILAILGVAVPAILWVLPWFALSIGNTGGTPYSDGTYLLTIYDPIIKLFNQPNLATEFIINIGSVTSEIRENVLTYYLIRENLIAGAIWYFISVLTALIMFIQGLVLLIRGRLSHPNSIVVTSFFAFLANGFLLLDSWRLSLYIKYVMGKALEALESSAEISYQFLIWPNFIVAGVSGGIFLLVFLIYLFTLRRRYYLEDLEFVDVNPQPFEKNNGALRNTLPNSITNVGGHAFSKNTYLEIANIPLGITELGQGAFANCTKLKVVSIPVSVKHIGANCFFNCVKLQRINYGGTKREWRKIRRGSNWLEKAGSTTVLCTDGAISVNPKH